MPKRRKPTFEVVIWNERHTLGHTISRFRPESAIRYAVNNFRTSYPFQNIDRLYITLKRLRPEKIV